MHNQRGSALLNVLAIVAMLLILGFGLMQAVNSDFLLAIRDADVTHAIQMAEGGIDYGIELLIAGPQEVLGEGLSWPGEGAGTPFLIEVEEGDVEVTIEEIVPDKNYVITSRSYRENATRQITAYVTYFGDMAAPFSHSLFIGGSGSDPSEVLYLQNLTIHGSVYIASPQVVLQNVTFSGDVHFASNTVDCSVGWQRLNIQATATKEPYTNVVGADLSHWASNMDSVSNEMQLPEVNIADFGNVTEFKSDWPGPRVYFHDLEKLNFFSSDVTIVFDNSMGLFPYETQIVVASTGSVTFEAVGQYQVDINRTLIVMAEGNIYDVGQISNKATNKPKVSLYLYSKGSIETDQNIYPSSLMAQMISTHSQNYEIYAPNPEVFEGLPEEISNAWGIKGFRITQWEN